MFKRLGLTIGTIVIAAASLAAPMSASAASVSSPAFFSTGKIDCVTPGHQLRIRTPTVGTLYPQNRLAATTVEASSFFRLSYDGVNWSNWALATQYARTTANYYAPATWGDKVLTISFTKPVLVQVIYSAFWWNGSTWIRKDLMADDYTTYINVGWSYSAEFCGLA